MADHVFIVLSVPPQDVPKVDFDAWYDLHLRQVLELPGWVAAQRFSVRFLRGTTEPNLAFGHNVRYEIEGGFDEAWAALRAAVDSGRMDFPDWYPRVETAGWEGRSEGPRLVAGGAC